MEDGFKWRWIGIWEVDWEIEWEMDWKVDWKVDPGSGKSYQPNYTMDHVTPGTYIEPGLGQPEGTERGIFGTQGTGDGGTVGERYR